MLDSFLNGAGFMIGLLVVYTIYDAVFNFIEKRREAAQAKKRKRRRH
jgi:hypothetical protein